MTTTCSMCGFSFCNMDRQLSPAASTESRRQQLRSRLSELNSQFELIIAERQTLLAESEAIVYPILSLPVETTIEIFQCCADSETDSSPSPSKAPLLLTQICRQWRKIALHAPEVWSSLHFRDEYPVELLELWISRSGGFPRDFSLHARDPPRAGALIETCIAHADHWWDVKIGILLSSVPQLALSGISFPMLHSVSFDIYQRIGNEVITDVITIQNAPLLREVHTLTLPDVRFNIPWWQLTTLSLRQTLDTAECIAILAGSPNLIHLTVYTNGPGSTSLVMPSLESLTCNLAGGHTILECLTLPHLTRLTLYGIVEVAEVNVLNAFLRNSECHLVFLSISIPDTDRHTLMLCLRSIPDSVTEAEFSWQPRSFPRDLFAELRSLDVLPHLAKLCLRTGRLKQYHYQSLVDMLVVRRQATPPRGPLESLSLYVKTYSQSGLDVDPRNGPNASTMTQLRKLASAGLKIKVTLSARLTWSTQVVLDTV
ncbi:hypothetical protein GGX14DRAFT_596630 [Mycena pura]|uniref:F-box domain-containing protein n=1 Tax=Mycena pura TaxID=153505 RepID=A0AAD6Y551_9AGAR|nr:hypothetical protein GGX14DRAFT_596630 [Mycena pura]